VVHAWDRDIDGAEELYKRASATDPHNGEAMSFVAAARLGKGFYPPKKTYPKNKNKIQTKTYPSFLAAARLGNFCLDIVLFFFLVCAPNKSL
jgi:hypothetical protein